MVGSAVIPNHPDRNWISHSRFSRARGSYFLLMGVKVVDEARAVTVGVLGFSRGKTGGYRERKNLSSTAAGQISVN